MTNSDTKATAGREVRQADNADAYPPTIICASQDCYQAITDPPLAGSIAFDAKNDAYVSTWDGNLFKLSQPSVGGENEPPEPPELIASGLNVESPSSTNGLALDGKGNAYVVNDATQDGKSGQLWRVPLDGEDPELLATGLTTTQSQGPQALTVSWSGDHAYVINLDGVLWRVSLRDGTKKQVATNLGDTCGVVLDGDSQNAYVVNRAGVLWRVPLPTWDSDELAVPVQVGTTVLGGPMALTLDWAGQNAYVVGWAGVMWRVPLNGGPQQRAAVFPDVKFLTAVRLDPRGNAYITEADNNQTASRIWRVNGVAASAPAPTIDAPPQGAHTAKTVKFNGHAPGAAGMIVQDMHRNALGSNPVVAAYWAWALGENRLSIETLAEGVNVRPGPVSHRGLPWDPGTHVVQFVGANDIGYTEPTPITFTVDS
ncbi:hypothetical protein [Streptomyces sp. BA2]|uniref:hypothetical protein n=1 Tax=Streptomyces sp. BA2 TaxID=436595 RepID=UPI00132AFC33|nr:hypothetical protein [Streptomyces sp. BA2]MWA07784.1 hypothetical protein [Streptomyces sp. BA2]